MNVGLWGCAVMAALFPEEGKNRYLWQPKPGYGYAIREGRYWPIPEEPGAPEP